MKKKLDFKKVKDFFWDRRVTILKMLLDAALFIATFSLAFFIDNLNVTPSLFGYGATMLLALPCMVSTIALMYVGRIYRTIWKYAGTVELLRFLIVGFASLLFGMIFRGLFTFAGREYNIPNQLVINAYLIFFFLAALYRISGRLYYALKHRLLNTGTTNRSGSKRVIVYGAGYTGATLIKRLLDNPSDGYVPVAIIDDNKLKEGSTISDILVEGDRSAIKRVIEKYGADVIAIAITMISKRELRSIYDYVKQFDVQIMITTAFKDASNEINSDTISIRNIKIEDLLHRDEHIMDRTLVDGFIKDRVIMVTGGAGSIGSEICRQALIYGCKHLVIFDRHENGMFEFNEELKKLYPKERYSLEIGSVRDRRKLREVMETYKPEVVLHAAAYKHVPMMEISADESVKNNIFGTKNVIEQCNESGVKKFILISTDKAINPANIMGATKRVAELCLQNASKTFTTQLAAVRFGNVLGSSGSVIPTFIKQINAGGPVTVTDKNMKRYFMTIPEAVRLVLQAGALANGGEVFVLDMGEPVYIYDLASDLIRMSGLVPEKDIEIKITGLRPGEKLFEELQYGDENVDKTTHKDIFICKLNDVGDNLNEALEGLRAASEAGDKELTEKLLFELVPSEYRAEHKDANARV